jgi:hypothetical protein
MRLKQGNDCSFSHATSHAIYTLLLTSLQASPAPPSDRCLPEMTLESSSRVRLLLPYSCCSMRACATVCRHNADICYSISYIICKPNSAIANQYNSR